MERHIKYIDEKIDKYMQELEETDIAEISDRKPNADEIKERLQELRDRKIKYQKYKKQLEEKGENEISTTDPDARLMCNKDTQGSGLRYCISFLREVNIRYRIRRGQACVIAFLSCEREISVTAEISLKKTSNKHRWMR